MDRSGVDPVVAEQIVDAVGSFALYGFPESHAISFAHLAYASAYLKTHRPSEFYCALLNNQPMGFYSPATLVRDAKRHGVAVRPVSVRESAWACRVEEDGGLRLGFQQVQGLRRQSVERMLEERAREPFRSLEDLRRRTRFQTEELRQLAAIGAFNDLAPHRRAALWEVERRRSEDLLDAIPASPNPNRVAPLEPMTPFERLSADYAGLRMTTGPHPMALVRDRFPDLWRSVDLASARDRERVWVGGQVICRQRPGTAKGVCFVSLEDETGITNVIVSPEQFEACRLMITQEPFLAVLGEVQRRGNTVHVKSHRMERLARGSLAVSASHDFG
jgi:error-prone DNA polymerase